MLLFGVIRYCHDSEAIKNTCALCIFTLSDYIDRNLMLIWDIEARLLLFLFPTFCTLGL